MWQLKGVERDTVVAMILQFVIDWDNGVLEFSVKAIAISGGYGPL